MSRHTSEQYNFSEKILPLNDMLEGHSLNPPQVKELSKVLRYLRDDIERSGCNSPLPSTWMIRSLLNCIRGVVFNPLNWIKGTRRTLKALKNLIHLEQHENMIQFFDKDMVTPLFPNIEGFTLQNLSDFIDQVESHLFTIDNHTG